MSEKFKPFKDYLEKIAPYVSAYTHVQQQVLQAFFYSVCADLLADAELPVHDIDHIMSYTDASFLQHYRSDCRQFHGDWAHLTALIPEECPEEVVETVAYDFEEWFKKNIPAPYNAVFGRLVEGEDVVIQGASKKKLVKAVGAIRKTARRRRAHTPPPPL